MTRACYSPGMDAHEWRLTPAERERLAALREELTAHDQQADQARKAILERMAIAAADIKSYHGVGARGVHTEIADLLGRSRNDLYRLIEQAELTAFKRVQRDKAERTAAARPGAGPAFLSPSQRRPTE
jgi:hypothetical protein